MKIRQQTRFDILVEENMFKSQTAERILKGFDAVIDCTGTYGNGKYMGRGGIPALGERQLRNNKES